MSKYDGLAMSIVEKPRACKTCGNDDQLKAKDVYTSFGDDPLNHITTIVYCSKCNEPAGTLEPET